jgi:hypothetical protein
MQERELALESANAALSASSPSAEVGKGAVAAPAPLTTATLPPAASFEKGAEGMHLEHINHAAPTSEGSIGDGCAIEMGSFSNISSTVAVFC